MTKIFVSGESFFFSLFFVSFEKEKNASAAILESINEENIVEKFNEISHDKIPFLEFIVFNVHFQGVFCSFICQNYIYVTFFCLN